MTSAGKMNEKFDTLAACVIIPTYNNATTIGGVIADVSIYTNNIIVVNDGSTDNTLDIISAFPFVKLITYPKNVGKGWALRKGFECATILNYHYAITIDSDGQHFAKDLTAFIEKLSVEPNAIIIGARNMNHSSVPGGSSFGNKFSNFWFRVETGIRLPDTQSGYRLYPLKSLSEKKFLSVKYEFEIEVIVRAAWENIKIISVPVDIYYASKEARISHFRPYKDFFRISVLNTILVLITFLYIKPRNFFRAIVNPAKFKQQLNDHLFVTHQTDQLKAFSIAFGVFMGIIPIWGFQLVAAIFLAILFKLNKALVIVTANISIPPMIPFIIFASYKAGSLWMGPNALQIDFSKSFSLDIITLHAQQYIYGSITLAVVAGVCFGLLSFIALKLFKNKSIFAK